MDSISISLHLVPANCFVAVTGMSCHIDQVLFIIGCSFVGVSLRIYREFVYICPNGFAVRIYLVFACIYPDTLGEKARSHPQGSHRPVIVVAKITVIACGIFSLISGYLDSVDISSFITPPPCKVHTAIWSVCQIVVGPF